MKGGGGSESDAKAKPWCSNCKKISALLMTAPLYPSSSSSAWRGGNLLLKVVMGMTMVMLIFSMYQTCAPKDSQLPVWLSLSSFVSRPSFVLPTTEFAQPSVAQSSEGHEKSDNFEAQNGALGRREGPSDSSISEENLLPLAFEIGEEFRSQEKVDDFEAENGTQRSGKEALDSGDSGSSVTEKDVFQDAVQTSQQVSNFSDSVSSPTEKDELKGIENILFFDSSSTTEGTNLNSTDSLDPVGDKVESTESQTAVSSDSLRMDKTGQETEQDGEVSFNGGETGPQEKAVGTSSEEVVHQQDAVNDQASGSAPVGRPVIQLELPETSLVPSSMNFQLDTPAQITEKPVDERRMQLEHELLAAKQAIEGATPADADPNLYRVIYHDVSKFSKSYKLMEEMFKVYVYKDGEPPLVHDAPLLGIYASEGKFIEQINRGSSPFLVEDPELAHMFYLPYSVTQMTLIIYVEGSPSMQPLNDFIRDYVEGVAAKYPFWNRTRGADHFFVSCHDWGPATTRDHQELRRNAVKVVCNADVNEEYVVGKDASLPEIYLHEHKPVKVGGPGALRRHILAFFAGQMHGHVRPILIEQWKDKDPDMKIYEVLPKDIEKKMNYVEHMKNSKFCICAAGFEVNSPRIVEAIYYDCVPVIIADNFILPFSDVLNWGAFSLTVLEKEIPNLKSILLSIPERQYRAMQRRLGTVRKHFVWNDEPVKYDMFHMIMHSVWMSRLNRWNTTS